MSETRIFLRSSARLFYEAGAGAVAESSATN